MELVIEIPNNKAIQQRKELKYTKSTENQLYSDDFLKNLRDSVADAENPDEAYNDILVALEEVRLADSGQVKLQSAREFMLEFDQK